jgi:hypothetical protein
VKEISVTFKLTAQQKANLPIHVVNDIESDEPDYYRDLVSVRMIKSATKIDDGSSNEYWYRGYRFNQDDSVPKGYYGRWRFAKRGFDSLEDVLNEIDRLVG